MDEMNLKFQFRSHFINDLMRYFVPKLIVTQTGGKGQINFTVK